MLMELGEEAISDSAMTFVEVRRGIVARETQLENPRLSEQSPHESASALRLHHRYQVSRVAFPFEPLRVCLVFLIAR
jgi:hypothetical protein